MLVQAVLGGPGSKSGHTLSGFYRKVSVKIEFMLSRTMRLCGRDAGSLRHTHHGRGCISQLVNTDYREYDAHCSDSDFMEFDGLQLSANQNNSFSVEAPRAQLPCACNHEASPLLFASVLS